MIRNQLLHDLQEYGKSNYITAEEQATLAQFIRFVKDNPQCFERSNSGHITASAWIISPDGKHTLLTHHRKLNNWFQLGGHNDGNINCAHVALQEAQEESGLQEFTFLLPTIFDIDIHAIPNTCAFHYDVRYLLQAVDANYAISYESLDLAWVPFDKIGEYSTERSVVRMHEKFMALALE